MHAIIFNRYRANSHYANLETYETAEEANKAMERMFNDYLYCKGFDPQFSRLQGNRHSAFIGSYQMDDYIILTNIDLDHPVGSEYNPFLEFAISLHESGELDM